MKEKPTILNYLSPFVMIALGTWHYLRHGVDFAAVILIVLGVFALYMALFNHPLLHRVLTFLTKLWYPIGQFITVLLLTATFFLVFMPAGIILRLLKKDILNKGFRQNRLSYWIDRSTKEENNYTQQF